MKRLNYLKMIIVPRLALEVKLEKDGSGYYGTCDSLPGVHVGGKDMNETQKNLQDAIDAYLLSVIKHLPRDTHRKNRREAIDTLKTECELLRDKVELALLAIDALRCASHPQKEEAKQ